MFQLLNKSFPFTLQSFQRKLNTALATGIFVTLFLWLFDNKEQLTILAFADNGAIVFISRVLFLVLFQKIFVKTKNTTDVKLWQYVTGVAIGTLLCFSLMYIYVIPVYFKIAYSFDDYINYITDNIPFVFPILLFVIAADYIFVLKNRLHHRPESVIESHEIAAAKIMMTTAETNIAAAEKFVLKNELGISLFKAGKKDILFIKSADNYIEITYLSEKIPAKKIVRYQLSAVESEIANQFLFRVHRSYLCNLENVAYTSGGVQNCTLHFKDSLLSVPVSRAKTREVIRMVKCN